MSSESSTVPSKCLSCSAELTSPVVCSGCHTLYPLPNNADHFSLLGLSRRYDLDESLLDERFLSVSRHVHPDYFGGASDEMRALATRLSAELNQAVKVLRHPVLRAGYLLELCGGPSPAEDRTVPPEVLGETMMLREEIDDAQQANDTDALAAMRKTIDAKYDAWCAKIATLARKLPGATADEKTQLRHAINAVRYFENMRDLVHTD